MLVQVVLRSCQACGGDVPIRHHHKNFCTPCMNHRSNESRKRHPLPARLKVARWRAKKNLEIATSLANGDRSGYDRQKRESRNYSLQHRYGITLDEFNKMLDAQDGTCAACRKVPTGGRSLFVVDHDHDTGKVRGLLCTNCNSALGLAGDSIEGVLGLLRYLNLWIEETV